MFKSIFSADEATVHNSKKLGVINLKKYPNQMILKFIHLVVSLISVNFK